MVEPTIANLRRGGAVQARAVSALMVRQMMLQYGRNNIGFMWIVVEPMLLTVGVMAMFSLTKPAYMHGTHVLSMVLTGYMPLTLWRHTSTNGVRLLRRSVNVLYHRNVTLIDVFYSLMFLEGISVSASFVTVYAMLWSLGIVSTIAHLDTLMIGWCLMWITGAGVALIFAGITEIYEVSEHFIQPIQYLTVPLSGIFFMVDWMPERVQHLLGYNPLTNAIEAFRDGFLGDEVVTHYYIGYTLFCGLVLNWIGLMLLTKARERLAV